MNCQMESFAGKLAAVTGGAGSFVSADYAELFRGLMPS
jgi:hypothetical protein